MYEMLVGYPPFYSDDPVTTCRKVDSKITLVNLFINRISDFLVASFFDRVSRMPLFISMSKYTNFDDIGISS